MIRSASAKAYDADHFFLSDRISTSIVKRIDKKVENEKEHLSEYMT
jgi:hypothetical protein